MSLNLQQRFLLFFADHRALREENIRQGDEIVSLRGQVEEERRRYDALVQATLQSQGQMIDKMMTPPPTPARVQSTLPHAPAAPKFTAAKDTQEFRRKLLERAQRINGAPTVRQ